MRGRIWIFAALVLAVLTLHLAILSAKVAQTSEDNVRARLSQSGSALRAQLDLLDARLSPRAVAATPDLVEATRPPADPTERLSRPDERALRAVASALSPEPDLIAVVNGQGAIVSRRAKAAQGLDDARPLPLAKAALEGTPGTAFAVFDGTVYRVAAARIPGNGAAAVVGTVVDDRLANQLKSQVDADVTLIQAGKVLASSLPQGEERARVLRWAAAPSPGYGVLQVRLPFIDNALSGKLPRGASRVAVRAALVPLDSGAQAALTVPVGPYFGWLARYQAFYLAALALFVLFSFFWGLFPPAPKALAMVERIEEEPTVSAVRRSARAAAPSLLGTDVGEPRATAPPSAEVPWPAGDAPEVTQKTPPPPMTDSLDPEVPAPAPKEEGAPEVARHPMWSADPFTPTPSHEAQGPETMSAEEAGLVDAEPDAPEPAPAQDGDHARGAAAAPAEEASSAAGGDFSFGGLLEDQARHESKSAAESFPGDEPTRIEPVSAALLDKMRERDEELKPPAPKPAAETGWGSLVPAEDRFERTDENLPPAIDEAAAEPAAETNVTMQDFSLPALEEQDPDEAHWRETFDKFKEMKAELGEPADKISFEKFSAKLRKNRADLLAKHNCKGVRFSVYEKDGRAAIKASAIR